MLRSSSRKAVESDDPATVTLLAQGKQAKPRPAADTSYLAARDPHYFEAATQFIALPRDYPPETQDMTDIAKQVAVSEAAREVLRASDETGGITGRV